MYVSEVLVHAHLNIVEQFGLKISTYMYNVSSTGTCIVYRVNYKVYNLCKYCPCLKILGYF